MFCRNIQTNGVSTMWEQKLIETPRGTFEYFVKGTGDSLAITKRHFSETNRQNTGAGELR